MTHTFEVRVTKIQQGVTGAGVLITADGTGFGGQGTSQVIYSSLNSQPRIGQKLTVSVTEDT